MRKSIIYISFLLTFITTPSLFATTWTNTAGRVFQAELAGLTETQAVFVMPNGSTNRLALTALSIASRNTARKQQGMPHIPECLLPTFNLCRKDLLRIDNLHADGRLNEQEWADARSKILLGFKSMCVKHKLSPASHVDLERRLLSGK